MWLDSVEKNAYKCVGKDFGEQLAICHKQYMQR